MESVYGAILVVLVECVRVEVRVDPFLVCGGGGGVGTRGRGRGGNPRRPGRVELLLTSDVVEKGTV